MFSGTPAAADAAPIWNGAYAGVHGGVTWAEVDAPIIGQLDNRNAVWGVHAGYNLTNGRFVIGVEGDLNFDGAGFSHTIDGLGSATAETEWSASLRARMGMTFGSALIYGTVGYARLNAEGHENPIAGGQNSISESFSGIVYGVGAEGLVTSNVSLRLEALRYDYSIDHEIARPFIDLNETVLRAGVTFHFN